MNCLTVVPFWHLFLLVGCLVMSTVAEAPPTLSTGTSTAPVSDSTACGEIVGSGGLVFSANLVYECMQSVPFNQAVATRFISYYNDSIQFQSTLAYLKDPPPSYQQQGIDLVAGLEQLQQAITDGLYKRQYDFEVSLAQLIYAAHDDHLSLNAGLLSVFQFGSPQEIVSFSEDGIQEPKVYLAEDVRTQRGGVHPPALKSINGINVTMYLEQFAANNSFGTIEPHADWNQLMASPASDVLGIGATFDSGAQFYPGANVIWEFDNGTFSEGEFRGYYISQGPTGPLRTGGDFYNFFVLGFYPDSFDTDPLDEYGYAGALNSMTASTSSVTQPLSTSTTTSGTSSTPSSTKTHVPHWENIGYPKKPDVYQEDLGTYGGGYVSGYFLKEHSVAVLSIPSFDEYGIATNTFQKTVQRFIDTAKSEGMKKVVIDVQRNTGGQVLLAIDTFQRFFPGKRTFAGSRMRAHDAANTMGRTMTTFMNDIAKGDPFYGLMIADEWVITNRINASTGEYFTSWNGFCGPMEYHKDKFTRIQQYNISSRQFDYETTGEKFNPTLPKAGEASPWDANDIIILSDGLCSSSCSLFLESMHHDAGVRVVTAGGRPIRGPMQGASGSRGALEYPIDSLDSDVEFAQEILNYNNASNANFLPNRTEANDVYITYASVNLRDQVRRNSTMPLQFAYLPADCRIYFTLDTVYNYTALWIYAANAAWNNPGLCVPSSTGHADSNNTQAAAANDTSTTQKKPLFTLNLDHLSVPTDLPLPNQLLDGENRSRRNLDQTPVSCAKKPCPADSRSVCKTVNNCQTARAVRQCMPSCYYIDDRCEAWGRPGTCRAEKRVTNQDGQDTVQGWCDLDPLPVCKGLGKELEGAGPSVQSGRKT